MTAQVQVNDTGSTVTVTVQDTAVSVGMPVAYTHSAIAGRAADDSHPTSAITGLDAALAAKQPLDADLTGLASDYTASTKALVCNHCDAATSAGLHIGNAAHQDVAMFGAGGSQGTSLYGQLNCLAIDSTSASGILTRAAATQDAIKLAGRAGGTGSYALTLTPAALSASRTATFPDAAITVAGIDLAQTWTVGQIFTGQTSMRRDADSQVTFLAHVKRSAGGTAQFTANWNANPAGTTYFLQILDSGGSFYDNPWHYDYTNKRLGTGGIATPETTLHAGGAVMASGPGAAGRYIRSTYNHVAGGATSSDAIQIQGRAGGTSGWVGTITTAALSASQTYTMPDATGTVALLSLSQTWSANQFINASAAIGATALLGSERVLISGGGSLPSVSATQIAFSNGGAAFGAGITVAASIVSTSGTGGFGYATGAGGAVTQITSRTTGVTLNKVSGDITLVSAAGSTTAQSFTVTNSACAATDTVNVVQKSGTDLYVIHVTAVAAGSFRITYWTTGGTTSEQPVFHFNIIKGVSA
jgi:hypothetical protein